MRLDICAKKQKHEKEQKHEKNKSMEKQQKHSVKTNKPVLMGLYFSQQN